MNITIAKISVKTGKTLSEKFLFPISRDSNYAFFTQLGLMTNQDRNNLNLGFCHRQNEAEWIYGINTFFDYNYTGNNSRLEIGLAAQTDYLTLSTNSYFGLTKWHDSKLSSIRDYDEQPAIEFDIFAEAYLPTYPKVGGKMKYEKYFGKDIQPGIGNK